MGKGRDKSAIFVSYSCYFNVGEKEFLDSLKFFGGTREKGDTGYFAEQNSGMTERGGKN